MKKTKIIASIGPSSIAKEVLDQMVDVGMNVVRVNFSHASLEQRDSLVEYINETNANKNRFIGLMWDTKGPELRVETMTNDGVQLIENETVNIVKGNVLGTEERFSISHENIIDSFQPGNILLFDDGLIKLQVLEPITNGVKCLIIDGGLLQSRKSYFAPGIALNIPFIGDHDKKDLLYACQKGGDFIAASFVSCAQDVLDLKTFLKANGGEHFKIISKIESVAGVENIDEILSVSDGLMVARGDLGVEFAVENVPMIQKKLIKKCRETGKVAIVATEMLESMKNNPRPTRAEVSDVSNAIFNGTDAVMLSGETAIGKYPVQVVKTMANICVASEQNLDEISLPRLNYALKETDVIASGVLNADKELDIKAIVATTLSGFTAQVISNLKPNAVIVAACPNKQVATSLSLNWGISPIVVPFYNSLDSLIESIKQETTNFLNLIPKDKIIITGGFPIVEDAKTNFLKIEEIV